LFGQKLLDVALSVADAFAEQDELRSASAMSPELKLTNAELQELRGLSLRHQLTFALLRVHTSKFAPARFDPQVVAQGFLHRPAVAPELLKHLIT
jgi:hypothetical protein